MNRSPSASPLRWLLAPVLVLAAVLPAAAQRTGGEFVPTFSSTSRIRQQMDRLQRLSQQKLWDEWLATYQGLVDDPGDSVVVRDPEFYVGVRYACAKKLAALPATVRARYRALYDADAGRLYKAASADGDQAKMREVYSRYRFSSFGPRALQWIAGRALDDGRPALARLAYARLVKESAPGAGILLRYALAAGGAGELGEARAALARVKKEFPGEPIQLAGVPTTGSVAADAVLKGFRPEAQPIRPNWTSFGGAGQRRMDALATAPKKLWEFPYPTNVDASVVQTRAIQTTVQGGFSSTRFSFLTFPVLSGDRLWVQGPRNLTQLDLATGKALWDRQDFLAPPEATAAVGAIQGNRSYGGARQSRAIQVAPVLTGHILTSRLPLGPSDGSYSAYPSDFAITAHDARSGDQLWKRVAGSEPKGFYWNQPTVAGDLVLTGMYSEKGGITEYTAVALDAGTGDIVWSTYLGAGSDPFRMTDGSPPIIKDGVAWIESTLYTLNAVDLLTGEVRWIYRYDPGRRYPGRNGLDSSPTITNEPISLLAAGSGPIVFCPRWGVDVVAIDPSTGKLIWSSPKASGQTTRGQLFGVDERFAYIAGDHLQAINLADGAREWMWEAPGGTSSGPIGFPILAGDRIALISDGRLILRSASDGKEVAAYDLTGDVGDQPGFTSLLCVDNLLAVGIRDRLIVYSIR